jgi:hypothetical protein
MSCHLLLMDAYAPPTHMHSTKSHISGYSKRASTYPLHEACQRDSKRHIPHYVSVQDLYA